MQTYSLQKSALLIHRCRPDYYLHLTEHFQRGLGVKGTALHKKRPHHLLLRKVR